MHAKTYPTTPPDFANWLAGFIDGEGCFEISRIHKPGRSAVFSCRICMRLRDDDRAILEEIQRRTGCGRVVAKPMTTNKTWISKPVAIWQVLSRCDCVHMIALLDEHPLRAKKARDYVLWRQAVLLWNSVRGAGNAHNRLVWEGMAGIKREMMKARKYHSAVSVREVAQFDPIPDQLKLAVEEGIQLGDVPPLPFRKDQDVIDSRGSSGR